MRSMLLACATLLLIGGSSVSAADNLYEYWNGAGSACANGNYGNYCQGCGHGRRICNPAPGAYRHAGYGFPEGSYECGPDGCYLKHGYRLAHHHHMGAGLHGAGGYGAGGGHYHPWQDGPPSGPPTAQVGYPYYTLRGPRDFLLNNPPSIGP